MKKEFNDQVERVSLQAKLTSLINEKEQIYMTLKQIYRLESTFLSLYSILFTKYK